MRSKRKAIQKARWIIAVALMLWCAGAGCALGTYAHATMRGQDSYDQAGGMAMTGLSATAGTHSCCKARHSSEHVASESSPRHGPLAAGFEEVALPESSSEAMSCCPLKSGTFLVTARQSVSDDRTSDAIKSDRPAFVLAGVNATPRALRLRLPNQNQTYLRCCVFLI